MERRRSLGIWLCALALLLQVAFGPSSALRIAAAILDPIASIPICHAGPEDDGSASTTPNPARQRRHDAPCPVCAVCCHLSAAALPASGAAVCPPGQAGFAPQIDLSAATPRAPPALRARARAPPATA